jgi:hypothetical protein
MLRAVAVEIRAEVLVEDFGDPEIAARALDRARIAAAERVLGRHRHQPGVSVTYCGDHAGVTGLETNPV